jgi:outer membrane protein OmpA-like peptidoglycan-associated protein
MKYTPISSLVLSFSLLLLGSAAAQAAESATSGVTAAQSRLQALQSAGVAADNYNLAKAQCWVNAANTAQSENDRSGFAGQALGEAGQLLAALEADKNTPPRYGAPANSSLRPDLAAKLKELQGKDGARCAPANLACAEVQLARAAHGLERIGPKTAAPYLYVAQCSLDDAQKQVDACPPLAPPPPPPPTVEKVGLGADALFRFDRSGVNDILPEGRNKLDALVQNLKTWKQVVSLKITGHTDRLGKADYNQRLSLARAETVKTYLDSAQVRSESVQTEGVASTQPVTTLAQCPRSLPAAKLIACLQPDRRIVVEISGAK